MDIILTQHTPNTSDGELEKVEILENFSIQLWSEINFCFKSKLHFTSSSVIN